MKPWLFLPHHSPRLVARWTVRALLGVAVLSVLLTTPALAQKTQICHKPGDTKRKILNIGPTDLTTHLAHGDYILAIETCNGRDDDCDGVVDDGIAPVNTTCGIGACASTGMKTCQGGTLVDSCNPTSPQTETCDSIDNDCDGAVDDGIAPVNTTCGVGICENTGVRVCQNGAEVDTCQPGNPRAATDTTCDQVDDDCNGQRDEDYVPQPTTCGVGACAATGMTECVGGDEMNRCVPGTPAANDATCDGIDDDCDGLANEDFQGSDSTCGLGACAHTVRSQCINGGISVPCNPFEGHAENDATCDGIDDDCNGQVDEDFVPPTCGQGVCQRTSQIQCVSGGEVGGCEPGPALSAFDTTCDLRDDNCNGQVDEDVVRVTGLRESICDDGIDNECDGLVDTADVNDCVCNDHNACTDDQILEGGKCLNLPLLTPVGFDLCITYSCNPTVGITFEEKNCDDGSACTTDTCDSGFSPLLGGPCRHENICAPGQCPDNCDDGNPCTNDVCDPVNASAADNGCVHSAPCDDGNACTIDTCIADICTHSAVNLCDPCSLTNCPDDGDPCTLDCQRGSDDTSFDDDHCAYVDLAKTQFCQDHTDIFDWAFCRVPICVAVTGEPVCYEITVPGCHSDNFTVPTPDNQGACAAQSNLCQTCDVIVAELGGALGYCMDKPGVFCLTDADCHAFNSFGGCVTHFCACEPLFNPTGRCD